MLTLWSIHRMQVQYIVFLSPASSGCSAGDTYEDTRLPKRKQLYAVGSMKQYDFKI